MKVEVGHEYLAPDPDDGRLVRVRVVGFGEPSEAIEAFEVEGTPVKRDVAHVLYLEGERQGTGGIVVYDHFAPAPD